MDINMKNKRFLKGLATGLIISFIVVLGYNFGASVIDKVAGRTTDIDGDITNSQVITNTSESKMSAIESLIEQYYLEDIDYDNLTEGTYAGLVSGLGDPYSVYYTEEEYEDLLETASGTYCGIGVTVQQDTNTGVITIVGVFKNSPAEEVKLQPGDIIHKVAGEDISGQDLSTVVSKIKGEEGTKVNITIYRENEYIDLDVERRQIEITTVEGEMLDDNVGYIAITEFEDNTYDQFVEIYETLEKQGMESVVFDLRNNPGGIYDTVVEMLDYILPDGRLVYTEDKYGNVETEYSDKACIDIPMAVIINGNSASASEIFAGAIKDYDAGEIVGTTSFGKGIVQRIFPLTDGSAVKLTISKYYTPNGENIHGTGIEPDVEVDLDEDLKTETEISHEEDNQLQAAIDTLK